MMPWVRVFVCLCVCWATVLPLSTGCLFHSDCCQLSNISGTLGAEMMEVVEERVVATFNLVPLTLEEQCSVKKRVQALMGTSSRSKKFLDRSPTLKTDQRTMGARSSSSTLAAPLVSGTCTVYYSQ